MQVNHGAEESQADWLFLSCDLCPVKGGLAGAASSFKAVSITPPGSEHGAHLSKHPGSEPLPQALLLCESMGATWLGN